MTQLKHGEFPQEYFIELDSIDSYIGRVTLHQLGECFNSDIDIVHKESKKIYHHVGQLFKEIDAQDALNLSLQMLSRYLSGKPL